MSNIELLNELHSVTRKKGLGSKEGLQFFSEMVSLFPSFYRLLKQFLLIKKRQHRQRFRFKRWRHLTAEQQRRHK